MPRLPPARHTFLGRLMTRLHRLDPDGLQAVFQRLDRERALLDTVINTIEDGVLVVDETERAVYINRAARGFFGVPGNGGEGMPIRNLIPALDWDRMAQAERGDAGGIIRQEIEIDFPRPRFLRLSAAPLEGPDGGDAGWALIVHDATQTRQATHEAVEEERMHALTLLAASVAHEIGNPLNALHIHLQLIERTLRKLRTLADQPGEIIERTDQMDGYLTVAKGEIARLDYIITEFLQAMRPTPPKLAPASLNDVVRETLSLLRPELSNRRLALEQRLDPRLPAVSIDAGQIKQALVNMVKNAMQATTRGGRIRLSTGSNDDAVWVSVTDTGAGISQSQLSRIFEPFFTTKQKGTGLGLMIVARIVKDHGGRIEVQSEENKGSTFTIWIPRSDRPMKLLSAGQTAPSDGSNKPI